ncbi:DJ-1/PfpI family protein [Amycolatopsis jejuensis]|uniref:DJ-1/PfpI family protein n=1 Tax=Amycolatopsis jejuensis TaxID=330084 RepID=UPI000525DDD5|nr:DJ-1/PfpI family protein [Amycolatopsis jejuensis]
MTEKTFAFVVYPGLTPMDLVGPLQVINTFAETAPDVRVAVVGETLDVVGTDTPLRLAPSHTFADLPAPSWLLVPGGGAPTLQAMADPTLMAYLRKAAATAEFVCSVCTGSLLLGEAGLLDGRKATTHWMFRDLLRAFGAEPVAQRWVEDGPVITGAGVAAGIDLALYLVGKLGGPAAQRLVQFGLEYDPQPPLGPLDWSQAPAAELRPFTERTVRDGLAGVPQLRDKLLAHL